MAKRMTDTGKWKKLWFRKIPPKYKLFWFYILDDCDIAGLWSADIETAEFFIGEKLNKEEFFTFFNKDEEKIIEIDNGEKWFIPNFIEFQCGPQLSKKNNVFPSINKVLEKYDLYRFLTIDIVDNGTTISSMRNRISKKLRERIFLEANLTCEYCQEQKVKEELVVDHFIPLNKNGDNSDKNLICSCIRCNSHKTDMLPDRFLSRNLAFLNPTDKILNLLKGLNNLLKPPYKNFLGGKDKEEEKEIYKGKGKGRRKESFLYNEWFEKIWKDYPNKDSKKESQRHFDASVKKEEDYKNITLALLNYKKHLALNTWKRPKSGKTWFNNWRDWINYEESTNGKNNQNSGESSKPGKYDNIPTEVVNADDM